MNKILLHFEGLAVLLLSVYFYSYLEFSWLLFIILLFAQDISMVGYLVNNKVGTIMYNIVHTYSLPIGLIFLGILITKPFILAIGLIASAHIGMDRMIGFGLKYPTGFKHTHLDRI